jgi:FkbM family methyltransferase
MLICKYYYPERGNLEGLKRSIVSLAAFAARVLPDGAKQALYTIRPLGQIIRSLLNRATPQGLTPVVVAAGANQGMHLSLDLQREKDYWLGTYEPDLQAAIQNLVEPGMVAFDVGANIGYISLMLARAVGPTGQVHAFEAFPDNVKRLCINLTLNDMQARISAHACAIVESSRPVRFLIGPSHGMGKAEGSAGREADQDHIIYRDAITVPGWSLDEFVYQQGNPAPQIVKMDIEGGEIMAFPGMKRLLQEARPIFLLELHGPQAGDVVWEYLTAAGYQIHSMRPGWPLITQRVSLDWKAYLIARPPHS